MASTYDDTMYTTGVGYKGFDGDSITIPPPEPVLFFAFENRAFFFSHRSSTDEGQREYRIAEFLRYGQVQNQFMIGD